MERNSTSVSAAIATDFSTASFAAAATSYKTKKEKQSTMKSAGADLEGNRLGGVAVHSQVIKIKQEIEKLKEPSPEIRRLLLRDIKRQRSRSPLGIAERAILVGNV